MSLVAVMIMVMLKLQSLKPNYKELKNIHEEKETTNTIFLLPFFLSSSFSWYRFCCEEMEWSEFFWKM